MASDERRPSRKPTARAGFFAANASEWLRTKGYSERYEACTDRQPATGARVAKGACESRLQQQPWWAFKCVEPRDRRALRGDGWAERWPPWMPAESFD